MTAVRHSGRQGRAAISRQHVNAYRRTLAEQHRVTGSLNEGVVSKAFADLLERTGRARELVFTPQWEGRGPRGNPIRVDGALIPKVLRIPFGYWEAKDEKDDLDREIARKRASGYPDDNIIYEDTRTAVLRQDGREVARVAMRDVSKQYHVPLAFFRGAGNDRDGATLRRVHRVDHGAV